jgi:carotenoid cleavage dioxygenase
MEISIGNITPPEADMDTATRPSAYSQNLQAIDFETELGPLPVSGRLPPELSGVLVRNGPNPLFPEPAEHWFAGDGMLHAFYFADGAVRYRNRWVRTQRWLAEKAAARSLSGNLQQRDGEDADDEGAANTNIVGHAGRLFALEEGHLPVEVAAAGLDTLGASNFAGTLEGPFTAHPKRDPETGELLFFGYGTPEWLGAGMSIGAIAADGRVTRFDRFEAPYAAMVHDFAVTRRHFLFPVMPLTASRERAQAHLPPFAWEPQFGTRVGILRRDRPVETIEWWSGPACHAFHVMNAWEAGGRIHIDLMQAAAPPLFPWPDGRLVEEAGGARLARWSFDSAKSERVFEQEWLCDIPGEFPRIDERFAGLAYRHGWFAGNVTDDPARTFSRIVHVDLTGGAIDEFVLPDTDATGEPVFVARTADASEGDGWILAVVFRGAERRSELLVFDALAIASGPVATVSLPHRVPNGFHGNWIAAGDAAFA